MNVCFHPVVLQVWGCSGGLNFVDEGCQLPNLIRPKASQLRSNRLDVEWSKGVENHPPTGHPGHLPAWRTWGSTNVFFLNLPDNVTMLPLKISGMKWHACQIKILRTSISNHMQSPISFLHQLAASTGRRHSTR